MVRRLLIALAALALAAAVVAGLTQTDGDEAPASAETFDLAAARARLAGAPAPLAALHAQSSRLLGGGKDAFQQRLETLAGWPVVVNKWASWCGPCRAEFPVFQAVATEKGREIAFLGVNSGDKRPAAERFLRERPLPFPSYEDPDEAIARALRAPANYPMTVFLDARGRTAFIHAGGYTDAAELLADIDRYLGA
jgi:cytochrome c biogenesis protein CcmG/thiol:disulfide interchange protein DsbE